MSLTDANLTIKEAHELLDMNGVKWSLVWLKTQVYCGKIASHRILNSRAIPKDEIFRVIREQRDRKVGIL